MTAAISDFFILALSTCIAGGILSSAFALLHKIWKINANQRYFHAKLALIFYITVPLLCLAVFLPQKGLSAEYTEFILRHELIHLQKKDILFKQILIFVKSFFWFNPLIYLFSKEFYDYCEIACDERLLKETGSCKRLNYAQCIISFAADKQFGYTVNFHSQNTLSNSLLIQYRRRV